MLPAPALWLDRTKPHRCSAAQLVSFRTSFKRNFKQCSPSPRRPHLLGKCDTLAITQVATQHSPSIKNRLLEVFWSGILASPEGILGKTLGSHLVPRWGEGGDEQAWKEHRKINSRNARLAKRIWWGLMCNRKTWH